MENKNSTHVQIRKWNHGSFLSLTDAVAIEKVFSVYIQGKFCFSTACTPKDMEELILGMLFSREVIRKAEQVAGIQIDYEENRIEVDLASAKDQKIIAGAEETQKAESGTEDKNEVLDMDTIFRIAESVFEHPGPLFEATGCAHCCALYYGGRLLCSFEDIGRHNALDKVIGYGLRHNVQFSDAAVFTSGRISADYLRKAIHAGIKTVISRAAVTDAAVSLAREYDVAMLGFVRKKSCNFYGSEKLLGK